MRRTLPCFRERSPKLLCSMPLDPPTDQSISCVRSAAPVLPFAQAALSSCKAPASMQHLRRNLPDAPASTSAPATPALPRGSGVADVSSYPAASMKKIFQGATYSPTCSCYSRCRLGGRQACDAKQQPGATRHRSLPTCLPEATTFYEIVECRRPYKRLWRDLK